ncbi:MAG: hypothetical protein NT062_03930 [Proteobacteria bacterium]|nr:hypothetical protein [Pseudomonadota bacterium]
MALAACATTSTNRTQVVVVSSTLPATIFVGGKPVSSTPASLVLRVDVPADIRIVATTGETYQCSNRATVRAGLVILQALLVPLWPGLVIDAYTGAWNDVDSTCAAPF